MTVNFKKGQNAYMLCGCLLVIGAIFWSLGQGLLWLLPADGVITTALVHLFLLDGAGVSLFLGGLWLLFALPGAFFNLDTERFIVRTILTGACLIFAAILFIMVGAFMGFNMLEWPQSGIFVCLGGLGAGVVSSSLFLHTARKPPEPQVFEMNGVTTVITEEEIRQVNTPKVQNGAVH